MKMDWFRWYGGTINDPKLALIARNAQQPRSAVIAVWAALLEHASQADERGDISEFDTEVMAVALDLEEDAILAIIKAMKDKGMIDGGRIKAWDKRQPKREDEAAQRAKEWREKQKQQDPNATERNRTQPNAAERDRTQANAGERNRTLRERVERESREEKNKEPSLEREVGDSPRTRSKQAPPNSLPQKGGVIFPNCPDWLSPDRWREYIDHRQAKAKPLSADAAVIILQDLEKAMAYGHDPDSMIRESISNGWIRCVFPDRHFQAPPPNGNGRRQGQTLAESMIETHARMDARLSAAERAPPALVDDTEEAPHVRH